MDLKVPYGSCDSLLDLFIYTYFSFLNGARLEPYRIFCIWPVFFKWVSNSFVFKECFHKTEFWMTLFPPVDSLAHSWRHPPTSWCCLGRSVFILISLLTPCVFWYEFSLSQLWHNFLCGSSTSHQIVPCQCYIWKVLLESWLGGSKNTFLGWIKMWSFAYDVTHVRIDATFKRLKLRQGDHTSTAGDEGCRLSSGMYSPLFPGRKL